MNEETINKIETKTKIISEKIETLVSDLQNNTYLKSIKVPKIREKDYKPHKSLNLILPLVLVGIIGGVANYLFINVGKISFSLINLLTQILLFCVLAVFLYSSARNKHNTKQKKRRYNALIKHQMYLNFERDEFIKTSKAWLMDEVNNLDKIINTIPESRQKEILLESVNKLHYLLSRFDLVINIKQGKPNNSITFELKETLDQIVNLQDIQAKANNISIELNCTPTRLLQDQQKVNLVIESILNNAIKFSKPNGIVRINTYRKSNKINIEFIDMGIGIKKDYLARLFEPFTRQSSVTKDYNYEGLGLSLYLDKIMLDSIGGKINIESEVNKGTKVTISIPDYDAKNVNKKIWNPFQPNPKYSLKTN